MMWDKRKIILCVVLLSAIIALILLYAKAGSERILHITETEKRYLQSISPVKLAVDPDWEPFEKINKKGEYTGIAADCFKMLEKRLNIKFEIVPTADWTQSLQYSKEGKVTVLSLLNKTPEREKWLIFTEPLLVDNNVIIGRYDTPYISDLSAVKDKTVVLPEGTSVEEKLRQDYPNLSVKLTQSEEEAFEMVSKGQADFTIRSMIVAEYNIRRQGWFDLKVIGQVPGYTNYLSIGVSKDEEMLKDLLDRAILSITEQERVDILNRHIPLRVEMRDTGKYIVFFLIITILGAVFLLILSFIQSLRAGRLERQNTEIREITARYEALSELAGTYFWQLDMNGSYTYVSPEVRKVLGFEAKELLGKDFQEYIRTENMPYYLEKIKNKETLNNHEERHIKKDGRLLWIKVDAMPVLDGKGSVVAYRGSSTDIEKRKQLEKALVDAKNEIELAYYQAQIGPHFLYNALNTIAMYCLTEPQKASGLIVDLSFFLRKSFDFKCIEYLVKLEQELELIEAYVNIEKVRFQNRLQVRYEIQEDLRSQLLPPLVLQPLVENAIHHGVMKQMSGGDIVLRAVRENGSILFEVRDDGIGIEESQIQELERVRTKALHPEAASETSFNRQGIGLKNIHSRLIKIYDSGLKIVRNQAGGTSVFFTLPENMKGDTK